jgi:hypothetical protein
MPALTYTRSVSGDRFAFTPSGWAVRNMLGVWYVFDEEDVFVGKFDTQAEAEAAAR